MPPAMGAGTTSERGALEHVPQGHFATALVNVDRHEELQRVQA